MKESAQRPCVSLRATGLSKVWGRKLKEKNI